MESHAAFNNLDYIVLGIILLSGVLALIRGFVREVLSLLGWAGAYYIAAKFYPHAEPFVHKYVHSNAATTMVAAVLVFVGALILFSILGFFTAKIIRGRALTSIDRSLGFLFGLLRGALVVCIVYMAATSVLWPNIDAAKHDMNKEGEALEAEVARPDPKDMPPAWLMKARTFPAMQSGATLLRSFLPEKTMEKVNKEYLEQKKAVQHEIDDKALEVLSTPAASSEKKDGTTGYDEKNRSALDKKVGQ